MTLLTKIVPGSKDWAVRLAETTATNAAGWTRKGGPLKAWYFLRRCVDLCRDYPQYRAEIKAAFRRHYRAVLRIHPLPRPEFGKAERYTCTCGLEYKAWPFWDEAGLGYQYERGESSDLLGCECGANLPLSR